MSDMKIIYTNKIHNENLIHLYNDSYEPLMVRRGSCIIESSNSHRTSKNKAESVKFKCVFKIS